MWAALGFVHGGKGGGERVERNIYKLELDLFLTICISNFLIYLFAARTAVGRTRHCKRAVTSWNKDALLRNCR
jgi:hypothetical protein